MATLRKRSEEFDEYTEEQVQFEDEESTCEQANKLKKAPRRLISEDLFTIQENESEAVETEVFEGEEDAYQISNTDEIQNPGDNDSDSEVSQEKRVSNPTVTKIYRFSLNSHSGLTEKESLIQLSQRFNYLQKRRMSGDQGVVSVFALKWVKAAIFIEAEEEFDVFKEVMDVHFLKRDPELVDRRTWRQLLERKRPQYLIEPGQWVRIKKHSIYQNDLARVMRVKERSSRAVVKVAKRVKKEQTQSDTIRPTQQAPISVGMIEQMNREARESYFLYKYNVENEFKMAKSDGFECVSVALSNLQTERLAPLIEELKMFFPDVASKQFLIQHFWEKKKGRKNRSSDIQVGDTVVATEFQIYCKVFRVLQKGAYEISFTRKNSQGVAEEHFRLVKQAQIKKVFRKHQRVYITSGFYTGQVGSILSITELKAKVQLDQNNNAILTVWLDDLGTLENPDFATLPQQQQQAIETRFHLDDLIRYGNFEQDVGCITSISGATLTLLNLDNRSVQVDQTKVMGEAIATANTQILTRDSKPAMKGDMVKIIEGSHRNTQAQILHCFREFFFLRRENTVSAERSSNCLLVYSFRKRKPMQTLGSNLVLNELIVIPDGPWKGYQGFVVERGNDYRLIQLVGKNIAIKVQNPN